MSVIFFHVRRFVHGSWNDWNICQNHEKCEIYRKKTLTEKDFRDYNEGVFKRRTRRNKNPCYRDKKQNEDKK